jgi:hypothetical protein
MIKYELNCWKTLKQLTLQHKNEICLGVNATKVEKSLVDGARLNPKHQNNGQSAAKPRTEEGSTTIPQGSRIQVIGIRSGSRPQGRRYSLRSNEN